MNAGALATIIYNNVEESSNGQRNWYLNLITSVPWIPSFSITQADGNLILQTLPIDATLKPYVFTNNTNRNSLAKNNFV